MASKTKKSGGDFILESRHLVGLFMLLVVIFGVVFTLGYLLGRSQFDTQFRAAIGGTEQIEPPKSPIPTPKAKLDRDDAPRQPNGPDWDFYHSADTKKTEDHLEPAVKSTPTKQLVPAPKPASAPAPTPPVPASKAVVPASLSPAGDGTLIPKGTIMLQVAAVTSEGDALALAQALQKKKFPAFVIPPAAAPGADKFYRVQVGPYRDNKSATGARTDLEANGFKSILKR